MDSHNDEKYKINSILNDIDPIIKKGQLHKFKDLIKAMHKIKNKTLLQDCYNGKGIDLITLICAYNNKKILSYLFYQSHILHYLKSDRISTEIESKTNSFYYAMCSNNFDILEMLYNYWSGDLHWLGHKREFDNFDVDNLKQLNDSLKNAFNKYEEHIKVKKKIDQAMLYSIHSLMAFNDFQKGIYSKLNELKNNLITWHDEPQDMVRIQETFAIRNMIVAILDMHEKHPIKVENWIKDNVIDYPDDLMERLTGTSTLIWKTFFDFNFEVYFRKLDGNVCLLILDNLHLLKLRLSMSKDSYQNLENKLYHFFYHLNHKWSLYLPKRKKMKVSIVTQMYKNVLCEFKIKYDANKLERGSHMIYLERKDFEKVLSNFNKELKDINVIENIRNVNFKLPLGDNNCLTLLPDLRDYYSLKKMSQHMAQLHSANMTDKKQYGYLLIERTLQVVGEFLKCSEESLHLQHTTEALVKAEISVELIEDLKLLRNLFSHAKNGELLKRIELETNKSGILESTRKELLYMKNKIDVVIKLYKLLVEKALIQNSISFLHDRKSEIPNVAAKTIIFIIRLLELIPENYNTFYEEICAPLNYFKSIMKEIVLLFISFIHMHSMLSRVNKKIFNNIKKQFFFYKEKIKQSLNEIKDYKKKWQHIVMSITNVNPSIVLSDYPNENDASKIKSFQNNLDDNTLKNLLEDKPLFASIENHWKFILNLLEFIVVKTSIFDDSSEVSKRIVIEDLKKLQEHDYKNSNNDCIVLEYLDKIEKELITTQNMANVVKPPKFCGIKGLLSKLSLTNFLTNEEKNYLIKTLEDTQINSNGVTEMIKKIQKDVSFPMKIYTNFLKSVKLDKKVQYTLKYLVMGKKRDPLLVQCFKKRVSLLREVTKDHTQSQLIACYKLDKKFRIILEVLLFDIFSILNGNKNNEGLKKSSKLLTEIKLRNILAHGSPLLEIIGNFLDSNDLPTELITKALEFIKDESSVTSLCVLIDSGFDFTQINSDTLSPEQSALVKEFKTSTKWRDYLLLIPAYKLNVYKQHKISQQVDEPIDAPTAMLLEAVNKKNSIRVQESVASGANVHFVNCHGNPVFHFAAMKGDVIVMGLLLNSGADINVRNKRNDLTALHYSAMNGFKEAVEFLLENGAECFAMDAKGRTPLYWANQRNHVSVSLVLLRALKRCELNARGNETRLNYVWIY